MSLTREASLWFAVFAILIALAIPWFLWGTGTVVAGLPLWLWWHIGWLGLSAVLFTLFAHRAWGTGVPRPPSGGEST